jgi:putative molybdopterin biosynthesis protein
LGRKIYLSTLPLSQAQDIFFNRALKKELQAETINTIVSCGRITAEPVFARLSSPHYHAAAMDGVAVKAQDTFGVTMTSPKQLSIGENAFYIDTGGALPPNCDAVIMIEDVYYPDQTNPNIIEIREPATPWQHVRSIGEDIVATEMILPSYHLIRPLDVGALLSGGIFQVKVIKKPLVSIIPTGSELVPPGNEPGPGQIIESNSYTFQAAVENWGGEVNRLPIVKDDQEQLKKAFASAAVDSDLVLVSAGSSAGRKDFTVKILEELGEVLVHGVAIKPGKPVILGMIGATPVVGVPGYPVAAYMTMELFVKPLLYFWQKQKPPQTDVLKATSTRRVLSSIKEEEFLRLKVGKVDDVFVATPLPRGAGVSMSLVRADGIATIPQDKEGIEIKETVEVKLWRSKEEINNNIVCLGSHDLSLDILSDYLNRRGSGYTLSSAHVGSMGGIFALKRGETHLAGMHLLDEESGVYNIPYLERFLPEMELYLVHLAKRELGLIVAPGNPLGIFSLEDFYRQDVVFINRQRGAGTRIFLDFMLQKKMLDPAGIRGYEREEYNHLSVAAAVAAGSADVGLGIRAAAVALGVDFIPIAQESYELAIPADFYHSAKCGELLEIIALPAFRESVEKMGGYDLKRSGELVWKNK